MCNRLLGATSRLPRPLLGVLAALLGDAWFYLLRVRRSVAIQNVTASELDPGETGRRRLVRQSCRHLVLNVLELTRWLELDDPLFFEAVEVRGAEHLRDAAAAGKGVVVVTAHLGNWELLGPVSHRLGFATTLVTRPLTGRCSHRWVTAQRRCGGVQLLEEGPRDLARMTAVLRARGVLGITIDQRPASNIRALGAHFLGRPARITRTAAAVALRTGAPMVVVTTHRNADGRHQVTIEPPLVPMRDGRLVPVQVDELTRSCCRGVERAIAAHPEQWLWHHRRWAGGAVRASQGSFGIAARSKAGLG